MSSNGNTHIILPGQRSPQQGMSAAQREEERQALIAHVDILTGQVNEVTRACGALIQAQRQNETLLADLTSGLAGTNLQLATALDRLTALDSHEDRIEALTAQQHQDGAWSRRLMADLAAQGVLAYDPHDDKWHSPGLEVKRLEAASIRLRLDAIERQAVVRNTSFMARVRALVLGR